MEHQPKISLPEAYFLVCFAIILDLINWIPVINIITTVISTASFQLYYFFKGVRGYASLATNLLEFIPILSALPLITTGAIITILIDRTAASKIGSTALKAASPGTTIKNPARKAA